MEEFYQNWIRLQQLSRPNNPEYEIPDEISSGNEIQTNDETDNEQSHHHSPNDIVYETPELKMTVEKGVLRRQKVFKVLDQMFHFKIVPKHPTQKPLLMSILSFLHAAIIFILDEIKIHFQEEDHNVAYLTLFQKPMVNGLNTGSFDLQDPNAAAEMTDRVLSMLYEYLLSNQSLVLNETFQIYLKILSVDHMAYRRTQEPR